MSSIWTIIAADYSVLRICVGPSCRISCCYLGSRLCWPPYIAWSRRWKYGLLFCLHGFVNPLSSKTRSLIQLQPRLVLLISTNLSCTLKVCKIRWVLLNNFSLKSVLNLSSNDTSKIALVGNSIQLSRRIPITAAGKFSCQMASVIKSKTVSDP